MSLEAGHGGTCFPPSPQKGRQREGSEYKTIFDYRMSVRPPQSSEKQVMRTFLPQHMQSVPHLRRSEESKMYYHCLHMRVHSVCMCSCVHVSTPAHVQRSEDRQLWRPSFRWISETVHTGHTRLARQAPLHSEPSHSTGSSFVSAEASLVSVVTWVFSESCLAFLTFLSVSGFLSDRHFCFMVTINPEVSNAYKRFYLCIPFPFRA